MRTGEYGNRERVGIPRKRVSVSVDPAMKTLLPCLVRGTIALTYLLCERAVHRGEIEEILMNRHREEKERTAMNPRHVNSAEIVTHLRQGSVAQVLIDHHHGGEEEEILTMIYLRLENEAAVLLTKVHSGEAEIVHGHHRDVEEIPHHLLDDPNRDRGPQETREEGKVKIVPHLDGKSLPPEIYRRPERTPTEIEVLISLLHDGNAETRRLLRLPGQIDKDLRRILGKEKRNVGILQIVRPVTPNRLISHHEGGIIVTLPLVHRIRRWKKRWTGKWRDFSRRKPCEWKRRLSVNGRSECLTR